jgi:hypothetical protein
MSYVVFEAGQRRLAREIPSRESVEPSNPIEWVRACLANLCKRFMERVSGPRADSYRTGHGRSLEPPANSSPKHPWLAARARVAWLASSLLLAERQTEGRGNKTRVPLITLTRAGVWGLLARLRLRPYPQINRLSPGCGIPRVEQASLHAR